MKVVLFSSLKDLTVSQEESGTVVTADGARLVTFNIDSSDVISAINAAFATVLSCIPADKVDTTLYMSKGAAVMHPGAARYTVIAGVSGMLDLDEKLKALMRQQAEDAGVTTDNQITPVEQDGLESEVAEEKGE